MGEIHEALRRANRVPAPGPAPDPSRERSADSELVQAYRSLAPPPAPARHEPGPTSPVPEAKRGRWQSREVIVDARGPASEVLRHLALRLRRDLAERGARSVAVLSALREEGKTTIACNLALALASLDVGRRVALVDLDLRRPQVASSFEIGGQGGIESVLAGKKALREACVSLESPPLDVYPALEPQLDAHLLLSQPTLATVVRELEDTYEIVLVDTPPVLLVPDAALILEPVKSAIVVGRVGRSTRRSLQTMCGMLPSNRLIGAILNDGSLPAGLHEYGYYAAEAGTEP